MVDYLSMVESKFITSLNTMKLDDPVETRIIKWIVKANALKPDRSGVSWKEFKKLFQDDNGILSIDSLQIEGDTKPIDWDKRLEVISSPLGLLITRLHCEIWTSQKMFIKNMVDIKLDDPIEIRIMKSLTDNFHKKPMLWVDEKQTYIDRFSAWDKMKKEIDDDETAESNCKSIK